MTHRQLLQRHLIQVLQNSSCELCTESDIIVLDFHHKDRSTKKYNVGNMPFKGECTIEDMDTEIAKCIVLCSNCHRRAEAALHNSWRLEYC